MGEAPLSLAFAGLQVHASYQSLERLVAQMR
jgi:hypothetical protein